MKQFDESELEKTIIGFFEDIGYEHVLGETILDRTLDQVILKSDLKQYLEGRYATENISSSEIERIIKMLELISDGNLYLSNKRFMNMLTEGFYVARDNTNEQKLFINLINYDDVASNIFKIVNQLEIQTSSIKRIPDGIIYVNGLPLVVLEFKSAIREKNATIADAYKQLTIRYKRDIPELFVYNAFCVISDGVNSKMGSFFADYEFYYGWRKVTGEEEKAAEGIPSLNTMINGLFDHERFCNVIHNFILMPDNDSNELKIVCRYPQYYAATKLYNNILKAKRPLGDGRGGTYFGSTGCGKSYAMLFLSRLLMRSDRLDNPTIILITDRTDLDDQLSELFVDATNYIGDENIVRFDSRENLKNSLNNRRSGGVFLTTIQKFTESAGLLTDRDNVICISDEAHRSQTNMEQTIKITENGVEKHYGFAKFLHDSLPNATYVGVTGTPIDETLAVFGDIIDRYTMEEAVKDGITVRITYVGRAAKVILDSEKLKEVEKYYEEAEAEGANEFQIEESKRAVSRINTILSDPGIIHKLAVDFVDYYERRVEEGATVAGKAMFVCPNRMIAYDFFKEVIKLRPEWNKKVKAENYDELGEEAQKELFPIEKIKLVITRHKDDEKELWDLAGDKSYRKKLDRQFKDDRSNFKIAIIVDMWTTGFDVPALDTMFVYKPLKRHTLIQTISRVNRRYKNKEKGLVVDYIGIRGNMNKALQHYGGLASGRDIEAIRDSINATKDELDVLDKIFFEFDSSKYYSSVPAERWTCLNNAAEFAMATETIKHRFMEHCKRMKQAYNICVGEQDAFTIEERDKIHFYLAVRSIIYKLTHGEAPDVEQMNKKVTEMVQAALHSDGVEEIFKIGKRGKEIDIFDPVYLEKIMKLPLPNTRIEILKQLLAKAISDFRRVNKVRGIDFTKRFEKVVEKYNDRKKDDIINTLTTDEITDELVKIIEDLQSEKNRFEEMGITFEEKTFYDILDEYFKGVGKELSDDDLTEMAKKINEEVKEISKYPAWEQREDLKATLKANLMVLLSEAVDDNKIYDDIVEQAKNLDNNSEVELD